MAGGVKRRGQPKREWRIGGWRMRNIIGSAFLGICFSTGFYLAQVYGEISALIEQRREALSSAIYSSPAVIHRGDDIGNLALFDRLTHLSYTQVEGVPNAPR